MFFIFKIAQLVRDWPLVHVSRDRTRYLQEAKGDQAIYLMTAGQVPGSLQLYLLKVFLSIN